MSLGQLWAACFVVSFDGYLFYALVAGFLISGVTAGERLGMCCVINHTSCGICPSAEVCGQGTWSQLREIEDLELRVLASSLPDVVLQGKAGPWSTTSGSELASRPKI